MRNDSLQPIIYSIEKNGMMAAHPLLTFRTPDDFHIGYNSGVYATNPRLTLNVSHPAAAGHLNLTGTRIYARNVIEPPLLAVLLLVLL
jgi:hypothetical protein